MVYIHLFHGRKDPKQDMDGWGTDGPTFGPVNFVHTTYGSDIKLGIPDEDDSVELKVIGDVVYYDGVYYGDWSVFGQDIFDSESEKFNLVEYDRQKSKLPE